MIQGGTDKAKEAGTEVPILFAVEVNQRSFHGRHAGLRDLAVSIVEVEDSPAAQINPVLPGIRPHQIHRGRKRLAVLCGLSQGDACGGSALPSLQKSLSMKTRAGKSLPEQDWRRSRPVA